VIGSSLTLPVVERDSAKSTGGESPDRGKGLARDMRVRWALEEMGQPYEVRLVSFAAMKEPAHLALHPFGQIPTYEEGDLALFESGAIVFHIAERHAGLLPEDTNARARAIMWMFAALSTVEPPIVDRDIVKYAERDKSWRDERMAMIDDRIRVRLPRNGPFASRSRSKNAKSRPQQQSGAASKQFTEIEERHFYSFCIRLLERDRQQWVRKREFEPKPSGTELSACHLGGIIPAKWQLTRG
jgi:hypothetical protein